MKIIYCKWHDNLAFILSDFNSAIEWKCAERVENDSESEERNERSRRIFENVDNESEPAKWSCPLGVFSTATQHQIRIARTHSQADRQTHTQQSQMNATTLLCFANANTCTYFCNACALLYCVLYTCANSLGYFPLALRLLLLWAASVMAFQSTVIAAMTWIYEFVV